MSDWFKKLSSLDADQRLPAFRKDSEVEEILSKINGLLGPLQKRFEGESTTSFLSIILLGAPRSGSTLLNQLMASRLSLGYVSNLMARFYTTPAVGAFLQKLLIGDRITERRDYRSTHGQTSGIEEPHEFGYFWTRHLGMTEEVHEPTAEQLKRVDIPRMSVELNSINVTLKRSTVMKCHIGNFYIPALAKIPEIFFIDLHRDDIENCCSILKVRKERLGSEEKWWSWRPRNFQALAAMTPVRQVAGQYLAIRNSISSGLEAVPANRKTRIEFSDLLTDPEGTLYRLTKKLVAVGPEVVRVGKPVSPMKAPAAADKQLWSNVSEALRSMQTFLRPS